jgi:hypothetical protein
MLLIFWNLLLYWLYLHQFLAFLFSFYLMPTKASQLSGRLALQNYGILFSLYSFWSSALMVLEIHSLLESYQITCINSDLLIWYTYWFWTLFQHTYKIAVQKTIIVLSHNQSIIDCITSMLVPKLWKDPESRSVFFLPSIFWCSCGGNHPQ